MSTTVASNPLGSESVTKLMLKFSIPSIISMLVGALYNIVDQLYRASRWYARQRCHKCCLSAFHILYCFGIVIRNWRCCLFQFENGSW